MGWGPMARVRCRSNRWVPANHQQELQKNPLPGLGEGWVRAESPEQAHCPIHPPAPTRRTERTPSGAGHVFHKPLSGTLLRRLWRALALARPAAVYAARPTAEERAAAVIQVVDDVLLLLGRDVIGLDGLVEAGLQRVGHVLTGVR